MERASIPERVKKVVGVTLIGAVALVSAGCVDTERAESSKIAACANSGADMRGSKEPVSASFARTTMVAEANKDLKNLRKRAKLLDGEINIGAGHGVPALDNTTPEIKVKHGTDVLLRFVDAAFAGEKDVLFNSPSAHGDFKIAPGALACTINQYVYPKVIDTTITGYAEATRHIK